MKGMKEEDEIYRIKQRHLGLLFRCDHRARRARGGIKIMWRRNAYAWRKKIIII